MSDKEFKRVEKAISKERTQLLATTRDDLVALLDQALKDITVTLATGQLSEYQSWRMTALQAEIDRVMAGVAKYGADLISTAADKAWMGGISSVDQPRVVAGISAVLPRLDTEQLMAMRTFMMDRIKDLSTTAASKIKQEIGLVMIGAQSIADASDHVANHLGDSSKSRATTIVRDNLSRAWAVAADGRAAQSSDAGVEMDKIWRRSGKIHSRLAHDLADGRRIPADQSFTINGHQLRFPHDPAAPIEETINCGCLALYRPRNTPGTIPDARPFTSDELALNPFKAQIQSGKTLADLVKK